MLLQSRNPLLYSFLRLFTPPVGFMCTDIFNWGTGTMPFAFVSARTYLNGAPRWLYFDIQYSLWVWQRELYKVNRNRNSLGCLSSVKPPTVFVEANWAPEPPGCDVPRVFPESLVGEHGAGVQRQRRPGAEPRQSRFGPHTLTEWRSLLDSQSLKSLFIYHL